jgi:hypothetical protein
MKCNRPNKNSIFKYLIISSVERNSSTGYAVSNDKSRCHVGFDVLANIWVTTLREDKKVLSIKICLFLQ